MKNKIIKIKLKSFDYKIINKSIKKIIEISRLTGAKVNGPVPMPTHIKKFTVLTSPHVDKNSRDQYEIRTYQRLIIIIPTENTVKALMRLNLSAGIDIKISII